MKCLEHSTYNGIETGLTTANRRVWERGTSISAGIRACIDTETNQNEDLPANLLLNWRPPNIFARQDFSANQPSTWVVCILQESLGILGIRRRLCSPNSGDVGEYKIWRRIQSCTNSRVCDRVQPRSKDGHSSFAVSYEHYWRWLSEHQK